MFYISIPKRVLDKVMGEAKATDKEIIGILVGNIQDHTIVIGDAISGEQESGDISATLPPKTIAKVTDKIMKGEVKGRVVGWYHSHPGFGIFMSSTDINTQNNLQQFSSKVSALIVDPTDEDFGFFTMHSSEGVIQLARNQVHIYDEGDEKVPERFSHPPTIPERANKMNRKFGMPFPQVSQPKGPNMKIVVIAVAAALICVTIGGLLFYRIPSENPEFSRVNSISLVGENTRINQESMEIFNGSLQVRVNVTVVEGKMTREGVRLYLGLGQNWWLVLGNTTTTFDKIFIFVFNTSRVTDGIYWIKANFTDSLNQTWEKESERFIIDNIPDIPQAKFENIRDEDTIDEIFIINARVTDDENNIYSVGFYYLNATGNWSKIGKTSAWEGHNLYETDWDTNPLPNGTYEIKVRAEDRNLYIDENVISVDILHGG